MVTAPWPHGGTAREGRVYEVTSRYALRVVPTHSESMVLAEYESECRNFFNSAFVMRSTEIPTGFKSVECPWLDFPFLESEETEANSCCFAVAATGVAQNRPRAVLDVWWDVPGAFLKMIPRLASQICIRTPSLVYQGIS